jgi:hypothetical protein
MSIPLTTVAWPTCDRIDSLLKSIKSFKDQLPDQKLYIFDDSENCETNNAFANHHRIRYCGRQERAALYPSWLDRELAEFALFGLPGVGGVRTVGANRNAVLLSTIGQKILMLDDDTIAQFAKHPDAVDGFQFSTDDPTEFWLLGQPDDVFHQRTETIDIPESLKWLGVQTDQGLIRASMFGVLGDCGMMIPRWHLLPNKVHCSDWKAAMDSRLVLRVAPQTTFSSSPFLMSTALGLFNQQLPPFAPMGRGSDGVFGLLLRLINSKNLVLHSPYAILHVAAGKNLITSNQAIQSKPIFCLSHLLLTLQMVSTQNIRVEDPQLRLAQIGKYIAETAQGGDSNVEEVGLGLLRQMSLGLRDRIFSLCATAAPELQGYLQQDLATRMTPIDKLELADFPLPLSQLTKFLLLYGELLRNWKL